MAAFRSSASQSKLCLLPGLNDHGLPRLPNLMTFFVYHLSDFHTAQVAHSSAPCQHLKWFLKRGKQARAPAFCACAHYMYLSWSSPPVFLLSTACNPPALAAERACCTHCVRASRCHQGSRLRGQGEMCIMRKTRHMSCAATVCQSLGSAVALA